MVNVIEHPWYDINPVLSHNALISMIAGGRGIGKTWGFCALGIRNALEKGEQFIYMRRYFEELKMAKATFFDQFNGHFEDWDFRVEGFRGQAAPVTTRDDKGRQWQTVVWFIALSQAQNMKSTAFPSVTMMIFDEFIIEKGGNVYLRDEVTRLKNLMVTVDRYNDRMRVVMLANAVSITNPYFPEWSIRPGEAEFVKRTVNGQKNAIVVHFPASREYGSSVRRTRLGAFVSDGAYGKYAIGNEFADNHMELIRPKPPSAVYMYTLETNRGIYSIWKDNGAYYAQKKRPKVETVFTLDPKKMGDDKTLVLYNDPPVARPRSAWRHARMFFDEPSTRENFAIIFTR